MITAAYLNNNSTCSFEVCGCMYRLMVAKIESPSYKPRSTNPNLLFPGPYLALEIRLRSPVTVRRGGTRGIPRLRCQNVALFG
jgi:hypothetical protein